MDNFIFALHADGRRAEISQARFVRWMSLFSGRATVDLVDIYHTIPQRALPPGVAVAYIHAFPDAFYDAVAGAVPQESLVGMELTERDEPFFALDANGRFTPITNGRAVEWLLHLYPVGIPTEARFVNIQAPLLPPGVEVAWFNPFAFYTTLPAWAQHGMEFGDRRVPVAPAPAPARRRRAAAPKAKAVPKAKAKAKAAAHSTDTRPLMTAQWRVDNADEYDRRRRAYPEECPICLRDLVLCVGPIHGLNPANCIPTRCAHMACCQCWSAIAAGDRKCPLCRDDVSEWLTEFEGPLYDRVRVA
jgi:hypothetical protein